ncbi:response regulator [Methylomonas sp. LL1]|uniref:response regulator n=1 Tax=Methylomonas sp. LL1 TaxID=2785785 RepID=UPI0018C430E6|nr:response regulator [Methylomonas sp. LL1]QPK64590.1 response regulator [Methylomonas sp. LL1]CAG1022262.1 Sporulation initiation phosphotransferase F [Methylococcales bacterium]
MSKYILVIDDEPGVRDAFELALTVLGYDVGGAADGPAGIEAATLRRPDLIFLDLRMPGMDGVETLKHLAVLHDTPPPVYIVTAFAREFVAPLQQARELKLAFQLAAKPLTTEQIRQITRTVIGEPA